MSDEIPAVCMIEDLVRILRTSRRTIDRLRRAGAFPIREIRGIDNRLRCAGKDVQAFIEGDPSRRSLRRSA